MVPIEEVAVPFLKLRDGINDVANALHGLAAADEAQLGGADYGGQRIADVGRRGLVVGLLLAVQLVVVGYQPVVLFGDEAVEEVPRVLGQLAHLFGLFGVKALLALWEFLAEPVHQERSRTPYDTGQRCGDGSQDVRRLYPAAVV